MMKLCVLLQLQAESEQYSVQKSKQDIKMIIFFHLYSFVDISFEDYDFLKSYLKNYSLSWCILYTYVAPKHFGLNDIRNGT